MLVTWAHAHTTLPGYTHMLALNHITAAENTWHQQQLG